MRPTWARDLSLLLLDKRYMSGVNQHLCRYNGTTRDATQFHVRAV